MFLLIFLLLTVNFSMCKIRRINWPHSKNEGNCVETPCKNLWYVFSKLQTNEDETIVIESSDLYVDSILKFHTEHSFQINSVNATVSFNGSSLEISSNNDPNTPVIEVLEFRDSYIDQCRLGRSFLLNISKGFVSEIGMNGLNPKRCHPHDTSFIHIKEIKSSSFSDISNWTYPHLFRTRIFSDTDLINIVNNEDFDTFILGGYKNTKLKGNSILSSCGTFSVPGDKFTFESTSIIDTQIKIESVEEVIMESSVFMGYSFVEVVDSSLECTDLTVSTSGRGPFIFGSGSNIVVDETEVDNVNGPFLNVKNTKTYISGSTFENFKKKQVKELFHLQDGSLDISESKFYDINRVDIFIKCLTSKGTKCEITIDDTTVFEPYLHDIECDINCEINGGYCEVYMESHRRITYEWILGLLFIVGLLTISALCLCITFFNQIKQTCNKCLGRCKEGREEYLTPLL